MPAVRLILTAHIVSYFCKDWYQIHYFKTNYLLKVKCQLFFLPFLYKLNFREEYDSIMTRQNYTQYRSGSE